MLSCITIYLRAIPCHKFSYKMGIKPLGINIECGSLWFLFTSLTEEFHWYINPRSGLKLCQHKIMIELILTIEDLFVCMLCRKKKKKKQLVKLFFEMIYPLEFTISPLWWIDLHTRAEDYEPLCFQWKDPLWKRG